jgi:hypothetical protein
MYNAWGEEEGGMRIKYTEFLLEKLKDEITWGT